MAAIALDSVIRTVSGVRILDDVSFEVADGELVVLMGSSGSGKTSVLRAVAGLDTIDQGRVLIGGEDVTDTPTRDRDVSMVFQTNALFDHRTVRDNISFPLAVRRVPGHEVDARVEAESRALEIERVLDRWPHQISHGHQQLVQVARAMVRRPSVFLLDEPLSMLDRPTRIRLRQELRLLQTGYGVTMLYATNDPEEALALADRVAILDTGRLLQLAAPRTVWLDPANLHVAELTGPLGLIDVDVELDSDGAWLVADGLRLRAWAPALGELDPARARVGVRPEAIRLLDGGSVTAIADRLVFRGSTSGLELTIGGAPVATKIDRRIEPGTRVAVDFDRFHVFDEAGAMVCTVG